MHGGDNGTFNAVFSDQYHSRYSGELNGLE
jgi:hypothetical protein